MNVFELAAKISLDKKGFDDGLNKAESRMGKFASGIKNVVGTVAKLGAAAIGAGGSAFVALTKQAFSAAADYEQLIGGVETLFKGAAGKVQQYANEAFRTAGISANDYMNTVTGFSASLLQSLGGDVDKAADVANMALIDMSDNANKMGTDMASIQVAYQGFAKQNYTMLDNLKLGYGGTRSEMERLLKDASKISGQKYDISNLADVYNAIHVIQTELDITGTTAKEAATTVSGSWGMVKGAFKNFLSGGGSYAYKDLAESLNNALDISIDRLSRIVPRLITQGREVLKSVSAKLPKLMETLMPGVQTGVEALLDTIADILPFIIETGAKLIPSIVKGLGTALVKVGKKAPEILKGLWKGIKEAAKTIGGAIFGIDGNSIKWPTWKEVGQKAGEVWEEIKREAAKLTGLVFGDGSGITNFKDALESIKTKWIELRDAIKEKAIDFLSGFTGKTPEEIEPILNGIAKGLTAIGVAIAIYKLGTTLSTVFNAITAFFASGLTVQHPVLLAISALAAAGVLIYENWDGISAFFSDLWEGITTWATSAYESVKKWWEEDIVTPIKEKWNAIVEAVKGVVENVKAAWRVIVAWFGKNIVDPVKAKWTAITSKVKEIVAACQAAWLLIVTWFTENIITPISSTWDTITGKVQEIVTACENAWAAIVGWFQTNIIDPIVGKWNSIVSTIETAISKVKEFFGLSGDASETPTFEVGGQTYADPFGVTLDLPEGVTLPLSGKPKANGLSFVPENDYLASLHFGEAVLSRNEAEKWRRGQSGDGGAVDLSSLTNAIVVAVRNGIESANIQLDGESVTRNVSRRQAEDIMARRFATV